MNTQDDNSSKVLPELDWDIQPDKDLWPDIHSTIRFTNRAVEKSTRSYWVPASIAACMMMAMGALIMSSLSYKRAQESYDLQANYVDYQKSQIQLIEAQHREVRAQFATLLNGEVGQLDASAVAEIQTVLMTIDQASLALKEAILAQPMNAKYSTMLARTYQQELKLLNKFKKSNGLSI